MYGRCRVPAGSDAAVLDELSGGGSEGGVQSGFWAVGKVHQLSLGAAWDERWRIGQ